MQVAGPGVTFTAPQIAAAGLTESQARTAGFDVGRDPRAVLAVERGRPLPVGDGE